MLDFGMARLLVNLKMVIYMYTLPGCASRTFCCKMCLMNCLLVSGNIDVNGDQCLQENGAVTLTCTVALLTTTVEWLFDSDLKATCSNLVDTMCIYPGGSTDSRYQFSSVVANGQFTFMIDPVSTTTDVGEYKCIHGIESKTVTLAICGKFPYISMLMFLSHLLVFKFVMESHQWKIMDAM